MAASSASSSSPHVNAVSFYAEYHGHGVVLLDKCLQSLRAKPERSVIWLLGDSSLDNKHWLYGDGGKGSLADNDFCADALNGYEHILRPTRMVRDVAYWMNALLCPKAGADAADVPAVINCAVEESTVADRSSTLLPQDCFVRDHVRDRDTLVVSVGGNDIALRPSIKTITSMAALLLCSSASCISSCSCVCSMARGCSCGLPTGLAHFVDLFGAQIERYIERVVAVRKPRRVCVCMIYYPDETSGGSWADGVLSKLGYDSNPAKLQALIRKVFQLATQRIHVEGTEVQAVPLFRALDCRHTADYKQRVEPSVSGGRKMAAVILEHVLPESPASAAVGEARMAWRAEGLGELL